ncbi:hypothetical protein SAMN04488168_110107 [Bacillus sp. 491mf]|nr:hypothetical protein SAMN04488168_110107 [Bacillus sp. 491mf]
MATILNFWSFVFSLFCVLMFYIFSFTPLHKVFLNLTGINPIYMTFYLTLFAFLISVMGLGGIKNRKSTLRSTLAILISVGLLMILTFIIFIGTFFEST